MVGPLDFHLTQKPLNTFHKRPVFRCGGDRKAERQKDRKTERQKDGKTERQKDRMLMFGSRVPFYYYTSLHKMERKKSERKIK